MSVLFSGLIYAVIFIGLYLFIIAVIFGEHHHKKIEKENNDNEGLKWMRLK
jgi:hypothetical protein